MGAFFGAMKHSLQPMNLSATSKQRGKDSDRRGRRVPKETFGKGPNRKIIFGDARSSGIAERTLWRAKSKLRIKAGKDGFQTEWRWNLPDTNTKSATQA